MRPSETITDHHPRPSQTFRDHHPRPSQTITDLQPKPSLQTITGRNPQTINTNHRKPPVQANANPDSRSPHKPRDHQHKVLTNHQQAMSSKWHNWHSWHSHSWHNWYSWHRSRSRNSCCLLLACLLLLIAACCLLLAACRASRADAGEKEQ